MNNPILDLSLTDAHEKLRSKEISSIELTTAYLHQINAHNETLNAYITISNDLALAQAAHADKKIQSQENITPLTGIPISLKDILLTKDIKTTCGSKILEEYLPPYNGTVVEKLTNCGAVFLGKGNMDEFAMGSSNESSYVGPCKNPWDTSRIPGGSSGGSAASVAGKLALASIGTDTGGSIRQPAALCGVSGIKPTYGRVSRYGVIAFASSLDQVGPLARNVNDLAIMLEAISGHDPLDQTSINQSVPQYSKLLSRSYDIAGKRIGIPKEYFSNELASEIKECIDSAVLTFKNLDCDIDEVSLPHTKYAVATYYIIAPAEASANLSRYDGVRFGYRSDASNLNDLYTKTRSQGFGQEVKQRIMLGTYALSSGYYDAYYKKAQQVRALITQDFNSVFKHFDAILTPTSPCTAFPIGAKTNDPIQMYLSDIYTISANLAGIPAMSIPCGHDSAGLPIGLQLMAPSLREDTLFTLGHAFQHATDHHLKFPKGY